MALMGRKSHSFLEHGSIVGSGQVRVSGQVVCSAQGEGNGHVGDSGRVGLR